jgi:hypothetical protein
MARKLMAVDGVTVHQRGDREVRVLFAPERLDAIAGLLKARRKRHLSPEAKQKAIANVAAARSFIHSKRESGLSSRSGRAAG